MGRNRRLCKRAERFFNDILSFDGKVDKGSSRKKGYIVEDYFDEDRLLIIESGYEGGYQLTREKNHEAVITYEYYQTEKVNWYTEKELWEGLKSFGLVKKTIEKSDGTKVEEKRYYISSLLLNINLFSYAIRTHWNIENKLHWQIDFTFKCDDNTTMNKKALYNLQIIKKFCLTILKMRDYRKSCVNRISFRLIT